MDIICCSASSRVGILSQKITPVVSAKIRYAIKKLDAGFHLHLFMTPLELRSSRQKFENKKCRITDKDPSKESGDQIQRCFDKENAES